MSIDAAFWLFFMLPLVSFIIGGFVWEAIKGMAYDHHKRIEQIKYLRKQNAQLRDELERLRQR